MIMNETTTATTTTFSVTCRVGDLFNDNNGFRAYLNRTSLKDTLRSIPENDTSTFCTYRYLSHRIIPTIQVDFDWIPGTRHSLDYYDWPPKGLGLAIDLQVLTMDDAILTNDEIPSITMHYEMYDGIPVMAKWLSRTIKTDQTSSSPSSSSSSNTNTHTAEDHYQETVLLQDVVVERIASYPPYGPYIGHGSSSPYEWYNGQSNRGASPPSLLVALTNQAHGTVCTWMDNLYASNDTTNDHETPFDMGASEPLLHCNYTSQAGPYTSSSNGDDAIDASFDSFKVLLLVTDSTDPERYSLQRHRAIQTLLPYTTENPIFFHAIVDTNQAFQTAIEQMEQVGFEMLIYSFGSSFQLESHNITYLQQIKSQIDYANGRGIEVGGYDLICMQRGHGGYGDNIPDQWSAVTLDGQLAMDACYASGWADELHNYIFQFINETGLSCLELDGPYGGGSCSATNHSHHRGFEDSIYQQTKIQSDLFIKLRNMGMYLNAPQWYFFQGQNRAPMGYDEQQYSLPRWEQLTISRMGMYDDLYRILPTQGWMFVPISEYHAGGDSATFDGHPLEMEWALAQYLGAGVAGVYRGKQLYNDNMETGNAIKGIMKKWIAFFKNYRETLIQPIIHLQRPTVNSWDGWLHINPFGKREVGIAMIFNPTNNHLNEESVILPLYYTGLTDQVMIEINTIGINNNNISSSSSLPIYFVEELERDFSVMVSLNMAPKSIHTIILERINPKSDTTIPL